jgi:hypothetical protein
MTEYFRPPSDYAAPKAACCDGVPYAHPVIGGTAWSHIGHDPGHPLVLDHDWIDVATGEWYPADQVLVLYGKQEPQPGLTR